MNLFRLCRLYAVALVMVVFRMLARGDQSVSLAWNPDVETNISNYNLYYGPASGVYTNSANIGDVTNCTVAGLQSGTTYYFAVTADNTSGLESPPSNEISYTAPTVIVSPPPGLPVLATMAASSVASASATLNGLVNPNGAATTAYFEFGAGTNYGAATPGMTLAGGVNSLAVNAPISGLLPGATYHFHLVATNAVGTTAGADAAFTTPAAAPTAITQPASGIAANNATLNGSVDPDGAATAACFEYGTSASYGAATPVMNLGAGSSSVAVNTTISGLLPGTTYHFHVVATSVAGTSAGSDATFATPAVAPSVIAQSASGITSSNAILYASVDPNGASTTACFEYGSSVRYGAATPATVVGAGTSALAVNQAIGGLLPATTYHFHIAAGNAAGTASGSDATFSTPAVPPPVVMQPSAPSVTTQPASSVTTKSATLHGSVDPNGASATGYFEYGLSTSYAKATPVMSLGAGTNSLAVNTVISGFSPRTTYHFHLVASNAGGKTVGADATFTTPSRHGNH